MTNHQFALRGAATNLRVALAALACVCCLSVFAQEAARRQDFDIAAGDAKAALKQFSAQTNEQLLASDEAIAGVRTNPVKGRMTPQEALDTMLASTGLRADFDSRTGSFAVRKETEAEAKNVTRAVAQNSDRPKQNGKIKGNAEDDKVIELDTFEVFGRKTLNMDIPRSRDDAQPYVVFARSTLATSGAATIDEFLKQRLTSNTQSFSGDQAFSASGTQSRINLRGLGPTQTLILIDGRRAPGAYNGNAPIQANLNGIPIDAIERIEVLATTASGIYGGSATGGVINVILRRDYSGAESRVTYENGFNTDTARRRIDFNAGMTLEKGRTNLLFAGSYSDANALNAQDRNFVRAGRLRQFANNPASLLPPNAPPLGGTTNIRSSVAGTNLTLDNGTPLNSQFTSVPAGYQGPTTDGGAAFVANAGRYNLDLANTSQTNGGRSPLKSAPESYSIVASFRREMTSWLQAFADFSTSKTTERPAGFGVGGSFTLAATATNNPFAQAIQVTPPVDSNVRFHVSNANTGGSFGLIGKLPHDWMLETDATLSTATTRFTSTRPLLAAGTTAFTNGTIDLLRDLSASQVDMEPLLNQPTSLLRPFRSTLRSYAARFSGPVYQLPAGDIILSGLLEHRREKLSEAHQFSSGLNIIYPERAQKVSSGYLETRIPIFGPQYLKPGVTELEVQLAVRYEDYTTDGVTAFTIVESPTAVVRATNRIDSVNPTLGLRYKPVDWLTFRASYGTGFLPPAVNQLVAGAPLPQTGSATDPKRGNTTLGSWVRLSGGNAGLKPEKSESVSAGIILQQPQMAGLRLSVDYTRLEKTDNIFALTPQQILDNEDLLPSRVVRGPAIPGDTFAVGLVAQIDTTSVNISSAMIEAYDVSLDFEGKVADLATWRLFSAATWHVHHKTRLIASAPEIENAGVTAQFPLRFRASGGASWTQGDWSFQWMTTYYGPYVVSTNATVLLNQGARKVDSQVFHDFTATYRPATRVRTGLARILSNTEIQVGIKNVLNTDPAFDAGSFPIFSASNFYYSPYGDPRLATYFMSVKHRF